MSVGKNIEITSTSTSGFEDAIKTGIARASKTVDNIRGAWIKEQKVDVENGTVTRFNVTMIVTFVLSDGD
jgi:flavin-binding protein dodecin